jgi:glycosyltransferase involved in cell wall biosynthesis
MSGALARLTLWAQRRSAAVPAPLRHLVGRALSRAPVAAPDALPGEDWSIPLIPGRTGGDLEALSGRPLPSAPGAESVIRARPRPPLRCVVATDVLDVGGMDEFVGFLGRRLPEAGMEAVVAYTGGRQAGTTGEGGRVARALRADGVPTVELSPDNAVRWLSGRQPHVISSHGAPDWLLAAATELGIPWVETLHGMHSFFHPDTFSHERDRARRISAQIAVSDLVRRQYLARFPGFPADAIVTIPNGVDERRIGVVDRAAAREALGLRGEYLFVSLSRYCLQKNVYGLVAAFAQAAAEHQDAHLLVAGRADDARYFAQVRAQVAGSPHADRVHLRGHCGNPSALLAAADGFVLDSFFEGWSLASMEALAAGVPVLMSDVGGAREQLGSDARRGYLVPNPAGDAELVDWRLISELRFRPQPNRAELVAAMSRMVAERDGWATDPDGWAAERRRLSEEARAAFPAGLCVRRHAAVLRAVAAGERLPDFSGDLAPAPGR